MNKIIFWTILGILFLVFVTMYLGFGTAYSEYQEGKRVRLVEEQIKVFEEKIKKGENVTLEDFLPVEEPDYSNKFSNLGLKTSQTVENYTNRAIKSLFSFLESFLEE